MEWSSDSGSWGKTKICLLLSVEALVEVLVLTLLIFSLFSNGYRLFFMFVF